MITIFFNQAKQAGLIDTGYLELLDFSFEMQPTHYSY